MKYISATELRTKASILKNSLSKGDSTYLLHRSEIIGVISPYSENPLDEEILVIASEKKLQKLAEKYSSGKNYTDSIRKKLYRKHLEEKYGKDIS